MAQRQQPAARDRKRRADETISNEDSPSAKQSRGGCTAQIAHPSTERCHRTYSWGTMTATAKSQYQPDERHTSAGLHLVKNDGTTIGAEAEVNIPIECVGMLREQRYDDNNSMIMMRAIIAWMLALVCWWYGH